jgi:hypothetical protein
MAADSKWKRPLVWITREIREGLKGANAPSAENAFATMADVGGGGPIPDPLELGAAVFADYVAVGASPAASGAVRLEEGGRVVGLTSDNSDNGGVEVGDQSLISLEELALGGNARSAIRIGDRDGPLSGEMWFDPYYGNIVFGNNTAFFGDGDMAEFDEGTANDPLIKKRLQMSNTGVYLRADKATALAPIPSPATFRLEGQYWDGALSRPLVIDSALQIIAEDPLAWQALWGHAESGLLLWYQDGGTPEGWITASNSGQELGTLDPTYEFAGLHANGFVTFKERTDIAAPAENGAVIYTRDTGGKTELVARFASGAIQRLAIEP